jgi:hypothetical protein
MPTKKIADDERPCMDPEHDPPKHMVYRPGTYEHTCPGCSRKIVFRVEGSYYAG